MAAGGRASPPSTAVDSSRMGQNPWIFGRHSHILMSNDHSVYRQSAGPKHPIPRQFGRLEPSAIQTRIGRIRSADSARGRNTSSPWLEFVESAERSTFSLEGALLPPRTTVIARPVFSARAFAIQGSSFDRRPLTRLPAEIRDRVSNITVLGSARSPDPDQSTTMRG